VHVLLVLLLLCEEKSPNYLGLQCARYIGIQNKIIVVLVAISLYFKASDLLYSLTVEMVTSGLKFHRSEFFSSPSPMMGGGGDEGCQSLSKILLTNITLHRVKRK